MTEYAYVELKVENGFLRFQWRIWNGIFISGRNKVIGYLEDGFVFDYFFKREIHFREFIKSIFIEPGS